MTDAPAVPSAAPDAPPPAPAMAPPAPPPTAAPARDPNEGKRPRVRLLATVALAGLLAGAVVVAALAMGHHAGQADAPAATPVEAREATPAPASAPGPVAQPAPAAVPVVQHVNVTRHAGARAAGRSGAIRRPRAAGFLEPRPIGPCRVVARRGACPARACPACSHPARACAALALAVRVVASRSRGERDGAPAFGARARLHPRLRLLRHGARRRARRPRQRHPLSVVQAHAAPGARKGHPLPRSRQRVARRNKGEEKVIASERIDRLVALAEEAARAGRLDRADRYADLSWRIKETYQLRGSAVDGRACRACHAFLMPGLTARVRLSGGKRSVTCLACGHVRRKVLQVRPPERQPG